MVSETPEMPSNDISQSQTQHWHNLRNMPQTTGLLANLWTIVLSYWLYGGCWSCDRIISRWPINHSRLEIKKQQLIRRCRIYRSRCKRLCVSCEEHLEHRKTFGSENFHRVGVGDASRPGCGCWVYDSWQTMTNPDNADFDCCRRCYHRLCSDSLNVDDP